MRAGVGLLEAGDHAQRRRLARARRAEQREELAVARRGGRRRRPRRRRRRSCERLRPRPQPQCSSLQDVEAALELVVRDAERDEDADHVAVDPAREEQQALVARLARDARSSRRRSARAARSRASGRGRAPPSPRGAIASSALAQALADRLARAAARRRARRARRSPRRTRRGCRRTCRRARRRGTASITSARPVTAASGRPPPSVLPDDEQVGLDAVVLDRPHRAGAAAARLHLVVDVEDPVRVEQLLQPRREVGRHRDEAALALHRLEHGAGDRLAGRRRP